MRKRIRLVECGLTMRTERHKPSSLCDVPAATRATPSGPTVSGVRAPGGPGVGGGTSRSLVPFRYRTGTSSARACARTSIDTTARSLARSTAGCTLAKESRSMRLNLGVANRPKSIALRIDDGGRGAGIEANPLSQQRPGLGLRTNVQHSTTPTTRFGFAAANEMAMGPENDSPSKTKSPSGGNASAARSCKPA